ncbi:MAG: hypothetical protein HPY50_19425 [Firmicutes bacterium]|nr:hypothetical protein [Bacillota bacterium]
MSLAAISIILLVIVLICSMFVPINVGIQAFFALYLYFFIAGNGFAKALAGFPVSLFMMLMAMLIFFAYATVNGTLDNLCKIILKNLKGKVWTLPIIVFVVTACLSAAGPSGFIVLAIAPIAMSLTTKSGISPTLMAIMLCNGGSAGGLSPVSAGGIVAASFIDKMGLPAATASIVNQLFINGIIANIVICILAYFLFGGMKLIKNPKVISVEDLTAEPMNWKQKVNLGLIGLMIVLVVGFKADIAIVCICLALVAAILKLADENQVFKRVNWGVLVMVVGIVTFIGAVTSAGGISMVTDYISKSQNANLVLALIGFAPGVVSSYSTSTGVVLPAFMPLIGDLIHKMPNIHYMAFLSTMGFCTYIVDASPLSTAGAACVAASTEDTDKKKIYRELLLWGFGACFLATIISVVLFGWIMYPV